MRNKMRYPIFANNFQSMHPKKKKHPSIKTKLHPRNKHRERYDFAQLITTSPDLEAFVGLNKYGDESVDFFDPAAVKALNKALLKHYYKIAYWEIPAGYLCPPIPGRADYIHQVADLLGNSHPKKIIPAGARVKCLDIGVGANCVYPIIGSREYGWSFIGSDIDERALQAAQKIIELNPGLQEQIELRLQPHSKDILDGIIQPAERVDITICNPPFHASLAESQAATLRKLRNLKQQKIKRAVQNFGGQNTELWYEGGEINFVRKLIRQSKTYSNSCLWFTGLLSKHSNLKLAYRALEEVKAIDVKTIQMGQGNKSSRIIAWTFHNTTQQTAWGDAHWQ